MQFSWVRLEICGPWEISCLGSPVLAKCNLRKILQKTFFWKSRVQTSLPQQHEACSLSEWNIEICSSFDLTVVTTTLLTAESPALDPQSDVIARDGSAGDLIVVLSVPCFLAASICCFFQFFPSSRLQVTRHGRVLSRPSILGCSLSHLRLGCLFGRFPGVCGHFPNRVNVLQLCGCVVLALKRAPPVGGWLPLA